jgi:hypothetical protein
MCLLQPQVKEIMGVTVVFLMLVVAVGQVKMVILVTLLQVDEKVVMDYNIPYPALINTMQVAEAADQMIILR